MKNIKIKTLELINFKGIKNIQFSDLGIENFIYGANGVGKSTLFDAFIWLLFGKDSQDRKDYEIKPLDQNNQPLRQAENIVKATLLVNDEEVTLSRTYKEKWTKQRGAEEKVFTGNVTDYTFNEVPCSEKEFKSKVSDLVDEKVFKLITNPYAFESLKWEQKREVLVDLVGNVSDEDLYNSDKDFKALSEKLTNKNLDEYDKQLKASIKLSKQEQIDLPGRIDEVERSKPESIDFTELDNQIKSKQTEISKIDALIEDKSKQFDEVINFNNGIKSQKYELTDQSNKLLVELRNEAAKICQVDNSVLETLTSQIKHKEDQREHYLSTAKRLEDDKLILNKEIEKLTTEKNQLVETYKSENAKQFVIDEDALNCPCCSRPLETDDLEAKKEEMLVKFNTDKRTSLNVIIEQGNTLKSKIEGLVIEVKKIDERLLKGKELIDSLTSEVISIQSRIDAEKSNQSEIKDPEQVYQELVSQNKELESLNHLIEKLNSQLKPIHEIDNSEFKQRKQALQAEIDVLKSQLNSKTLIELADKRITELKDREKSLSQEIAKLEREQFIIERFKKAKTESLEQSVNQLFSFVKFKLFEQQVNGAEVPTCKALINGVPFSTANLASQINAGIDIINTLCKVHQVTAPIFVDNRESCTELIETPSQVINLIVSPGDKKLRLEKQNVEQLELA